MTVKSQGDGLLALTSSDLRQEHGVSSHLAVVYKKAVGLAFGCDWLQVCQSPPSNDLVLVYLPRRNVVKVTEASRADERVAAK